MYFAFVDRATGKAAGHAAYMRIDPGQRVIEVGAIVYAPGVSEDSRGYRSDVPDGPERV